MTRVGAEMQVPVVVRPETTSGSARRIYSLYGLLLDTPCEITGLQEVEADEATIALDVGDRGLFAHARREVETRGIPNEDDDWFQHSTLNDASDYLRWTGHFEFLVDPEGRNIVFRELEEASPEALHAYLLGQVLSFALLKRGIEPLHATAIVVDGRAVAFVGDSGAGKSTLAAAFLAGGCPLLTDDLLVLQDRGEGLHGHPGMPRIKLYPDAAAAVLPGAAAGIEMNQWTPKRIVPLGAGEFQATPVPLSWIFLLTGGADPRRDGTRGAGHKKEQTPVSLGPEIAELDSRRAFLELLQNTYNPLVDDSRRLRQQFQKLSQWVERIPISRLTGPRDLGRVGELKDAVLRHLGAA